MDSSQFQEALSFSLREVLSSFQKTMTPQLANVKVPEFSGERSQDVVEWLDQLEQVTLSFTEEQRKQVLKCAFVKSARAWFKDDLESQLGSLSWQQVKKAILNRYKPNKLSYYAEQLNKLTYSENEDLASFVDQRVYLIKKAFPTLTDREIIRETTMALPATVRSYLNLMSNIDELKTVQEFKILASRYDQKIDITISQPKTPVLDPSLFESLLQNAVNKVIEKMKPVETQVVAVAKAQPEVTTSSPHQPFQHNYVNHSYHRQPRRYPRNNQGYQQRRYNHPQQQQNCQDNAQVDQQQSPVAPDQSNPHQQYPARQSRKPPPGPCYNCGGNHWNVDCPKRHLNAGGS
jgi:hypothetical protein